MARSFGSKVVSFAAAAGAVGATAALVTVCPLPCNVCTSCVSALLPMGAAAGAVGAGMVGSAVAKNRGRKAVAGTGDDAPDAPGSEPLAPA
jgi:hypothetical protein